MKIRDSIGLRSYALVLFAALMSCGATASSMQAKANEVGAKPPPAIVRASYNVPVYAGYGRPELAPMAVAGQSSGSSFSEVNNGAMFAAIMGLIGLRLLNKGKKRLPVIK